MYSCSPNMSRISLKNSFGKVVFQILAKIEMSRNENRLFGRHFETVHIFYIFFQKYGCNQCIFIWCKDNLKIPVGKWFFKGGSMEPPFALTGVRGS